jgi:hypothetical protein
MAIQCLPVGIVETSYQIKKEQERIMEEYKNDPEVVIMLEEEWDI